MDADRAYNRAEALVDSLIGNASSVLDKTALVTASSDVYSQHFALIAQRFNDPVKAYSIIEQVRGRVTRDLLAQRLRRDLEILCGCRFHCKNAFWDRERQAYVDMNWQLFNSVFYFKERADSTQPEMPFGFIEVSSVLQQIATTRGFFALGFHNSFFYDLKPLEQRLAIDLAKNFIYQALHQRFVDDLAKALPIDAQRGDNVRAILKTPPNGCLPSNCQYLPGSV